MTLYIFIFLENVNEITRYETAPEEFLSTCQILDRVESDKWFTMGYCNASQTWAAVVKTQNLRDQMKQHYIFAKLINNSETFLKLWLVFLA